MPASQTVDSSVYRLGRVNFTVKNCDASFVKDLDQLMPLADDQDRANAIEVRTGCETDLRGLINHLLKKHLGCLWVDAAFLVSPSGKKILLVGDSGAGKSTTAMSLAMGHNYKVGGEDIVLFDQKTDEVLTFASPFSLKKNTKELLTEVLGKAPDSVLLEEWLPVGDLKAPDRVDAHFDAAIFLGTVKNGSTTLNVKPLGPGEFLRKILHISNILRHDDAAEIVMKWLKNAKCLYFESGTLPERIEYIKSI